MKLLSEHQGTSKQYSVQANYIQMSKQIWINLCFMLSKWSCHLKVKWKQILRKIKSSQNISKHYKPAIEYKIFTSVCSFSFLSPSSVNLLFYDSSTLVARILLLLNFHDLSIYFPKSKYFMFHEQNSLLILMDIALFGHGRDPTVPFPASHSERIFKADRK